MPQGNRRRGGSWVSQMSAASTDPNHPSFATSAQMPHVMCKYQPKKGTDNIQPTACELPWLQQKGAWTALRSYACWADVALPDPNHTRSGQAEEPPLVLSQTTEPFKFNCLICPIVQNCRVYDFRRGLWAANRQSVRLAFCRVSSSLWLTLVAAGDRSVFFFTIDLHNSQGAKHQRISAH